MRRMITIEIFKKKMLFLYWNQIFVMGFHIVISFWVGPYHISWQYDENNFFISQPDGMEFNWPIHRAFVSLYNLGVP